MYSFTESNVLAGQVIQQPCCCRVYARGEISVLWNASSLCGVMPPVYFCLLDFQEQWNNDSTKAPDASSVLKISLRCKNLSFSKVLCVCVCVYIPFIYLYIHKKGKRSTCQAGGILHVDKTVPLKKKKKVGKMHLCVFGKHLNFSPCLLKCVGRTAAAQGPSWVRRLLLSCYVLRASQLTWCLSSLSWKYPRELGR